MRVAFISEHASPLTILGGQDAGGQNVYVDALARRLAARGVAVDVFTRRDAPALPEVVETAPGVRVVHVDAGPDRALPKDDLWPLMPAFRDGMLAFLRRDGARYGALHGHFWMSGWVAVELGCRLHLSTVQTFHALGRTKRRHQGAADPSPGARIAVEGRVVREADRLVAQCPNERAELVGDYGASPAKVALVSAGVDTTLFRPTDRIEARRRLDPRLGIGPEDAVVVYVGRVLPRKDVRNVVRAFARLAERWAGADRPALRLLVVGGETREPDPVATPEIGELRRLAAELGVADRVRFAGGRQPGELHRYYGAGDVAVSTPWYEPFGLTPLEAMACGRPVVGADVGGIAHTVRHGETGYLVPPRDPDALAARLDDLLLNPDLRDRLGRAARARVERHFTWDVTAAGMAAVYDRLGFPHYTGEPRAAPEGIGLAPESVEVTA